MNNKDNIKLWSNGLCGAGLIQNQNEQESDIANYLENKIKIDFCTDPSQKEKHYYDNQTREMQKSYFPQMVETKKAFCFNFKSNKLWKNANDFQKKEENSEMG